MSKERVISSFTYKKGEANIREELLPERLPYMSPGVTIVRMELRKAGRVMIDGEEFEFQELYVLVKPPAEGA